MVLFTIAGIVGILGIFSKIPLYLNLFQNFIQPRTLRRGRLVVYGAALERRFAGNCIEGSNPSPSATIRESIRQGRLFYYGPRRDENASASGTGRARSPRVARGRLWVDCKPRRIPLPPPNMEAHRKGGLLYLARDGTRTLAGFGERGTEIKNMFIYSCRVPQEGARLKAVRYPSY